MRDDILSTPLVGDGGTQERARRPAPELDGDEADGPPPVDFERGAGTPALDGGGKQTVDLSLRSGRYALVCLIPNRAGSPPHVALRMIGEVTVQEP